ncbi:MAG: tetratricopeptide repeat protein [Flavobacteriia bacterium]|jgi:tetratricopeptide (TPR) repeat protein
MRLTHVIVFVSLVFLSACGSFKNKGKETKEFSAMEYPYIEAFHEGIRLKTRGQITEAITMFEKCLAMKQDDDAVYYALSELYLMKSEPIRSVEYIQKAAKLDPKNIWYIQELAYMYVEQGNNSEAVKNFELLVKEQPQNVEWLYGYAECLVKVGKVAEAIKALDRTEDQIGVYPDLSIQKFKLYVQIKQPEKGIQEIEAARKIFPDDPSLLATLVDYYFQTGKEVRAVSLLEDLVKATPENGRAHLALADVYRQQGKQAEAYVELKKAFTCDDVELDTKMKILINIHESSYKIDPEVYELVELLVIQFPLEAKAHSIRGDYMLRAEKEDEALKSYKEALKYDKKQYPIWNQVLIMEYQRTQFEELYADSKVCLEYFPTVATVYLLNGVGAVQTKRFDEAINVLETGKELVVNDKALESEMFGQLGEAYFQKNNIAEGKTNYDKALKLDPKSALLKNNYAYRLALARADLDKALTMIDEVLKEGSESAHYLDTKGFVLFQQNKFAEAMQLFEKAFALRSNDKIITEHIGDGYLKTGNKEKAVEYWKKARELGSTNKNLDKKIEKKEYYEPIY